MKKVIVVLIIFAVMIAAGIGELLYTSHHFKNLHDDLWEVQQSMQIDEQQIDRAETIEQMQKVMKRWEKNKNFVFIVSNHAIMRNVEERLISLKTQIEINASDDAFVSIDVLLNYIEELITDNHPKLINIF